MKRILHISKYYYPFSGGTEQVARDCVLALKGKYEQRVIAFNDGCRNDEDVVVDGIEVAKCGCIMKISSQSISLSYRRKLKTLFCEFQPDIIIFHYPNPYVAAILLKELKGSNIRLVLYWHLDIVRQKCLRIFFTRQNRKLLQKAVRVIVTSPNYLEGSRWLCSVREKCVIVPNCINTERMTVTSGIEKRASEIKEENKDKTICVAVGRHTEYKGFTYLIQASRRLDDSFHIYIAGTGELTDTLNREAENDKKITLTGRVSDEELKALLLAADIFCFPSITKNEAFGLALAEAMYYGKPSVTFTIEGSGVNYVNVNGTTGLECPNRDYRAYAEAMDKLGKNEELRKRYGEAARKRVLGNFTTEQFNRNIRGLMDAL